jgi:hypothetical protein
LVKMISCNGNGARRGLLKSSAEAIANGGASQDQPPARPARCHLALQPTSFVPLAADRSFQ